jgi:NAD-dependent SIR2 family protein deacetylase
MQCMRDCGVGLFSADRYDIDVDPTTFRARPPLPRCPQCGSLARPNILMFGDYGWDSSRSDQQAARLEAWLSVLRSEREGRLVVVECGAGSAVPTVRSFSERLVSSHGATLVRVNAREPQVPRGQIGLAKTALAALTAIDERLAARQRTFASSVPR